MICKFHGIKMLRTKKLCEEFTKKAVDFYTSLINGEAVRYSEWESDESLAEEEL
jgi:hypothetical protein